MHQTSQKAPSLSPENADITVKKWLLATVRGLVDHPESIKITSSQGQQTVIFEVECDRSDIRRLIGRGGQTAEAVRRILAAFSGKNHRLYRYEILEPYA